MGLIDNMQRLREDEFEDELKSRGLPESEGSHSLRESSPDEGEIEYAPGTDDTYDPVRTYLAALGAVPLLKREQEVALAKQIERGEKLVMTAVSRSPIGIEAVLRTVGELRGGTRSIKNVIQIDSDAPSAEKAELKRTLKVLGEVSRLYSQARRQRQHMKGPAAGRQGMWPLARLRVRISRLVNGLKFSPFERARLIELTRAALEESVALAKAARRGRAARSANDLLAVGEEKRLLQRIRRGEAMDI